MPSGRHMATRNSNYEQGHKLAKTESPAYQFCFSASASVLFFSLYFAVQQQNLPQVLIASRKLVAARRAKFQIFVLGSVSLSIKPWESLSATGKHVRGLRI